jgi:hypothetical protein
MASVAATFDERLELLVNELVRQWNIYSIILVMAITGYMGYAILTAQEPDVHPMLLARQASVSAVRQQGESAVYRAADTPEGLPLRSGLNVRLPSDPPYSGGRDGDLRDIWRKVKGEIPATKSKLNPPPSAEQTISTVLGKEKLIDHNIEELSTEIDIIGGHLKKLGVRRVAVYMPNSVELLNTLFGRRPCPQMVELIICSVLLLRTLYNSHSVQSVASFGG